MTNADPRFLYTITLKDGTVTQAVRTRNTWNVSKTGAFVAYDQDVVSAVVVLSDHEQEYFDWAKKSYARQERERIHAAMLDAWQAYYDFVDFEYQGSFSTPAQLAELGMLAQVAFDLEWRTQRLYTTANAPSADQIEAQDAADMYTWAMGG